MFLCILSFLLYRHLDIFSVACWLSNHPFLPPPSTFSLVNYMQSHFTLSVNLLKSCLKWPIDTTDTWNIYFSRTHFSTNDMLFLLLLWLIRTKLLNQFTILPFAFIQTHAENKYVHESIKTEKLTFIFLHVTAVNIVLLYNNMIVSMQTACGLHLCPLWHDIQCFHGNSTELHSLQ